MAAKKLSARIEPVATLVRFLSDDMGTVGRFNLGDFKAVSIELPWRGNQNGISCILAGRYRVLWTPSPRLGKYTYEITGVPGRAGIRLHSGNLAGDESKGLVSHSRGCPLIGHRLGAIDGQRAVLLSRPAVRELEAVAGGRPFILEVTEKWNS
jgi:hypothetical protein